MFTFSNLFALMKHSSLCVLVTSVLIGSLQAADGPVRWHVVLAAVGNEQQVFDNFVLDFATILKTRSDIVSLSELHASVDQRWQPGGMQTLERTLTSLQPMANEGCLIYLTGHGAPEGLAISADTPMGFVRPTRMESMLNSCNGHPTVLIVSACFSGVYIKPGITRDERIVMTASAADLTSFGCSNNNKYTFFDQCFLDAWPRSNNWGALADDIRNCVRNTERNGNFPGSKPQFFFGPTLRELAIPAVSTTQP